MSIVKNLNPDINFWEMNTQLKFVGVFKHLYDGDSSRGKKESSKIMWFVAFCYEIEDNKIYSIEVNERHELVGTDLMNDKKYYEGNKSTLTPLIELYCKLSDSPAKRQLRMWNKKMDEKTAFLDSVSYDLNTFEAIEKMWATNSKLYKEYETIMKDLSKENNEGSVRGGKEASLSDKGEI